jgi:SpoVK/Ycf46/Vps4 family AAA+-type ATPase
VNYPGQGTSEGVRPGWIEDLTTFYRGRIARQFVLHFNITDFVIDLSERRELGKGEYIRTGDVVGVTDQFQTMREYLHRFLFDTQARGLGCQSIYTYSLAGGLVANDVKQGGSTALDREVRGPAWQRIQDAWKTLQPAPQRRAGQPQEGREVDLPANISENFKLLGHMLRQKHYHKPDPGPNDPEAPIAVILDYVEKLIPYHLGEGQGDREQLQALEVIQRWALDPLIRQTRNIIILLTTNIGQIPSGVYAEGSGCRAIRIPLPDEREREAFIRFKLDKAERARRSGQSPPPFVQLDTADFGERIEEQARRLARATQGMRLTDIDNVSRRVIIESWKGNRSSDRMKADDVQRVKGEVIQAQSAQLLEIVPPVRGFNEIGGLENLKQYLRKRTALMLSGKHSPLVPSGLLLAGPPGTGKTIIAEALATESGFNLVKMRNIQDKWVGSSERNLELVLNLLKDLHPVVVFVDEIDQAMVRRDSGQSGDSGVGARMFARILEEMSNGTNRGRILWVAATNRADIIDEALLRRFDRVVPLLTPDVSESCRIFATIINTIMKQSAGDIKVAYGGDLQQSGAHDERGRTSPTQEDLDKFLPVAEETTKLGLTGAGIEIVVRRAIEMAYEEMMDKGIEPGDETFSLIELRHLLGAVRDFKPNHKRLAYDYQSLLAIRACNFRSVIPSLSRNGVFGRIQRSDGEIDSDKLEAEISELERRLNSRMGL